MIGINFGGVDDETDESNIETVSGDNVSDGDVSDGDDFLTTSFARFTNNLPELVVPPDDGVFNTPMCFDIYINYEDIKLIRIIYIIYIEQINNHVKYK